MKKSSLKTRPDLTDEQWVSLLESAPENRGIDIRRLFRRMREWCELHQCQPTRRRLLVWLDNEREAVPMADLNCPDCNSTHRVVINDYPAPCPTCRPTEYAQWRKQRGK